MMRRVESEFDDPLNRKGRSPKMSVEVFSSLILSRFEIVAEQHARFEGI